MPGSISPMIVGASHRFPIASSIAFCSALTGVSHPPANQMDFIEALQLAHYF
jgi:hypothetical protein